MTGFSVAPPAIRLAGRVARFVVHLGSLLALAGLASCQDDGKDPPPINVIDTDAVISAGGPGGMEGGTDPTSGSGTAADDDDDDDDDEPTAGDDDDDDDASDTTAAAADTTGPGAMGSDSGDDGPGTGPGGSGGPPPLPTTSGKVPN